MFEKDYILRLLSQFFDDLNLFINKKTMVNRQKEMISLYNTFVGDYTFYHIAATDAILKSFDELNPNEKICKMQMLAELYFQEALIELMAVEKLSLCRKSLEIWEYIDINSDTYSMDRKQKIEFIKSMLQEIT